MRKIIVAALTFLLLSSGAVALALEGKARAASSPPLVYYLQWIVLVIVFLLVLRYLLGLLRLGKPASTPLIKLCYLAKDFNYYLDRIISTLLVDIWLPGPTITATKGIKKGRASRMSAFRKLNAYLDRTISDISVKVDIWRPVPTKTEEEVASSIEKIKRSLLEAPRRAYQWIGSQPRQIVSFLLGLVIVLIIVLVFLIALGYIRF